MGEEARKEPEERRKGKTHPNVCIRETRLGERLTQPKIAQLHVIRFVKED